MSNEGSVLAPTPIGEVEATPLTPSPGKRRFSTAYKIQVLESAAACSGSAEVAALLRREGLYHSHLQRWKAQRESGALSGLGSVKPGPKPKEANPLDGKVKALEREKRQLEKRLKRAELLLEIQKKTAELMGWELAALAEESD
jgi:hypothetical protein